MTKKMFKSEEFKKMMQKFHINVGQLINDVLKQNLPKEELEKELLKIKKRVERIKKEQQEFIETIQSKCPHKNTQETIYNNIKHIFCSDCLKQLKIERAE